MAKRLVLNGALKRTGNGTTEPMGGGLPRYAFIAHPSCCERCNTMDSRLTGRLYSVGDTWRISHINCLCSTVEVPAAVGMGAAAVQAFAANPVGGILRRGFNFGQSFAPTKLTEGNVRGVMEKATRLSAPGADGRRGRFARKNIVSQQKSAYRRKYNRGKENWNNVLVETPAEKSSMEKVRLDNGRSVKVKQGESFGDLARRASSTKMQQAASRVKVARNKAERPMFTASGGISAGADVKKKKRKQDAAKVMNRRAASRGTRELAKLFGASVR
ncbi:MAG: hypothetical protein MJY87_02450 [Fibrobacter sp.]|nr:hypothetical protein [Fibrobacter sp.]